MDDSVFQQVLAEFGGVLSTRQRALPAPPRELHQRILGHFADTAAAPALATVSGWSDDLGVTARDALARLVEADLVEADPDSATVRGAYPFVAEDRGHRVRIDGGQAVQACCAVDALGIPAMLGRDATITSRDPHTEDQVHVQVRGGKAAWQPPDAVVTVPPLDAPLDGGDGRQAADATCPTINFHASAESAHAYQRAHGLTLEILTVPQALQAGSVVFGSLLLSPTSATSDEDAVR